MSYDREERSERKPQKPIRYTYRYQKSPKTPEVHGVTPKLGDIISTKAGPAKVLEVFWRSATNADVLLRPVESETKSEKPEVKKAAPKAAPKATPKAAPRPPRAPKAK